jgi:photosystem II stability/assembly factor-like uncharacterized protein
VPQETTGEEAADEADEEEEEAPLLGESTFSGLRFRGIGPALMSGRVSDIAIDPRDRSVWYVAVASGGVWKTENCGTTWKPIFDKYGSYSTACLALDPANPLVVWLGTGENNSQRSVGFGDGVYKSLDGGKSWKNVGLKESEHIGKILVHPDDGDVVYVAAQGPLWSPGGDRGLYKTTDGGATWEKILEIDENTGVSDIVFDPRDPDVIYASAYQRRRHVWTLVNGGPESAIHKTTDGGKTWKKLRKGLPGGDVGRIGLAVSPQRPDVVYAIVEAAGDGSGFYRSADGGQNWEKRSGYVSSSPQYYQEIFADPHVFDRIYSMDVRTMATDDGGKNFYRLSDESKHVDNHALAFDPDDPDWLLIGCDGGLYESFDRGENWDFKANLPVTQFYKLCVDNDLPFYNVYGGTQDNNTQGGPSRTRNRNGITNREWFVTVGGDGFKPQVDPKNPDIVYSQAQHGVLRRYDRRTGERVDIQPMEGKDEEPLRWNWDSALLISPHLHTRLYFGANKLFRSDDRGDTWRAVSPDLTRNLDRNTLEVMGKVWSVDAVAKNRSTSFFGNIVSIAESPLREGLVYVGTDDGLVQVTEDGGESWREIESFPGVPEMTYVADLEASLHDADTVYAVFNNHKMGDFAPYLLVSRDRGVTWTSIAGDLPERGPLWAVAQDHERPELLFAGTEFGCFFTVDEGNRWVRLKGGLPVIAIRDIEIQRRESDLCLASFGRGFFIIDDYTPLRHVSEESLEREGELYPVKNAPMFIPAQPLGGSKKASQGDSFYVAPNPPFGAVFTYYLKEGLETREQARKKREKEIDKEGGTLSYPSWDELRAEDREKKPVVLFTITDEDGEVVRRITGPTGKGFHRTAWNLRYPASNPADLRDRNDADPFDRGPVGPMVVPGTYTVRMATRVDGVESPLGEARSFEAYPLGSPTLPADDRAERLAFQKKVARLQRAVLGAQRAAGEAAERIRYLESAIRDTPKAPPSLRDELRSLELRLRDLEVELDGDSTVARRNEPTPPSISDRIRRVVGGLWSHTQDPTQTQRDGYEIAAEEFERVLADLRELVEADLAGIEDRLEDLGAPWTPGRLPRWERE